jgi:putative tricarboxylic transport membrane protein
MAENSTKSDRVGGLIWLLLGIGLCIGSKRIGLGNFHKPGSGFMPFLSGAMMGLFGAILLFYSCETKLSRKERFEAQNVRLRANWINLFRDWKNFFFTLLALFGYALLLNVLGFPLTTFLFFFFLFRLTETEKWLMPLFLAGVMMGFSYLLFSVWLGCQFPRGVFGLG